ncbi:MAG: hypothetical protein Pg6C_03860 [Treponemataceae bacterium]|nr:MAG: hypothetical protein Pg6C_03860 [Treponemataceae bacterium]
MKRIFDRILRAIDRTISGPAGGQVLFFAGLAAIVFLLLFAARVLLLPLSETGELTFWKFVENYVGDLSFEDFSAAGRFLALTANLLGTILFGGMLVSLLTNIIGQRTDRVQDGEAYYRWQDHSLVIGFDPMCPALVRRLAEESPNSIVVAADAEARQVRRAILSGLEALAARRITVVSCGRASREDLLRLRIPQCSCVFLLGESGEADRDSKNIECLELINTILAEAPPRAAPCRCHVLFDRQSTFAAFQQQEIPGIRERIDFVPFNFCDIWAQTVFVDTQYNNGEIRYRPLDFQPITADSDKRVHLAIIGMTNMGIALGVQAVHLCHYPNFITKGIKTRITFIDENADRELDFLKGRLRYFFEETDYRYRDFDGNQGFERPPDSQRFTDIEFEFIKGRVEQDAVQELLAREAARPDTYLTIAAAMDDSNAAAACALYLPQAVYDSGAQILARQELSCAVLSMLSRPGGAGAGYRKYANIRPFGMLDNCYGRADDLLPMMIKWAYDNTSEEKTVTEFPEADVRRNWAANWKETDNVSALKMSNRYCANYMGVKQRSLGIREGMELDAQQIRLAARMEHNRWVAEKLLMGFRAPSPAEAASIAAEKKREYYKARLIHEDIKSYDALGEDGKQIDVKIYDINISRALPYMLGAYRRIKHGINNINN